MLILTAYTYVSPAFQEYVQSTTQSLYVNKQNPSEPMARNKESPSEIFERSPLECLSTVLDNMPTTIQYHLLKVPQQMKQVLEPLYMPIVTR